MNRILTGVVLVVVLGGAVAGLMMGVPVYNGLVQRQERASREWAQVETVLQRRYELIPSLLELTKDAGGVETGVIKDINAAYLGFKDAKSMDQRMEAAGKAEVALGRLPAFVGQMYPQLQSNARYQDMMRSLEQTENLVAERRMRFNEAVSTYNEEARTVAGQAVCKATGLPILSYYNPPGATQQALGIKGSGNNPSGLTVATGPTAGSAVAVWRLQGTMQADQQWTAVVTAPDGKTHNAKKGAVLASGAKVVDVLEDRVILEEESRNAAGQVVATRVVVTR